MIDLQKLLTDKTLKPKQKTETLCQLLLDKQLSIAELIEFAEPAKDPIKATCIEAMEFVTQKQPDWLDKTAFTFVTNTLTVKAPRIKWESAKVVGNTAHLHQTQLDEAIKNLLMNTKHEGTVVRWSAAFALTEILKLKTKHNTYLLQELEQICELEEKNSIKKIYLKGFKELAKR